VTVGYDDAVEGTTTIVAARVRTMIDASPIAEAIAYRGPVIVAVGTRDQVTAAAGGGATVVDAGDATVLPGFVDAHHHMALSALYGGLLRLTAPRVTDIGSLQAALADAARSVAPGRWLVAMDWDEARLAERRPPTRRELDDAVPDRPVFALHYTCHRAVANSRALELASIGPGTPDPSGGAISRGRGGLPDGLLIERGMSAVEALARPDLVASDVDGFLQRMAAHYRAVVAAGITRVADLSVPIDLLPLYRELVRRGGVLIPTLVCPVSAAGYLEPPWDLLDGPVTGHQDGPLTIGPVKLVFDGVPGCAMCLSWWQALAVMVKTVALAIRTGSIDPVRTGMSTRPRLGTRMRTGIAIYRRDEAAQVIAALADRGFGVATHALGNDAVANLLDAYEAVGARLHEPGVPRIEHAMFLDRKLVRRIADGGFAVVSQPAMVAMPAYANVVGIPGMPFNALRWLADAGVPVAFGSDYPVFGFDPLDGVRGACSRRNARGAVVDPDQRLTLDEALAMATRGGAAACGASEVCGTLEIGKRADLVVIDGEPDHPEARVRATVVGGRLVHGQLDGGPPAIAATLAAR
jgi:predicted amidohydrolase YtcJ